jgi:nuclear pore complex protein Nup54
MAPYYRPDANEDPKAWEEALSNKPGPAYIPVLCTGFAQLGKRIEIQQQNLAGFNSRLHEINNALSIMMQDHETKTSVRAIDARRKHLVLKQRCLALATKVQVLRNRGYAMGGDEEDLRTKLSTLEKHVNDPGLHAKEEEIWARMVTVRERANILKNEIEKSGQESLDSIDEDTARRAKKVKLFQTIYNKAQTNGKQILEDYETQLRHLKDELLKIHSEFNDWENERGGSVPKAKEAPKFDTQSRPLQFV